MTLPCDAGVVAAGGVEKKMLVSPDAGSFRVILADQMHLLALSLSCLPCPLLQVLDTQDVT
jgi:hypothetical protein